MKTLGNERGEQLWAAVSSCELSEKQVNSTRCLTGCQNCSRSTTSEWCCNRRWLNFTYTSKLPSNLEREPGFFLPSTYLWLHKQLNLSFSFITVTLLKLASTFNLQIWHLGHNHQIECHQSCAGDAGLHAVRVRTFRFPKLIVSNWQL